MSWVTAKRPSAARSVRVQAVAQPGGKVSKWLSSPWDVATFGARATLGAVVSLPERLQMLQSDAAKVAELLQSPAPLEEKGQMVLQEVEDTLVDCLRRGADVETDVLSSLKAALPADLAAAVDSIVPPLPDGGAPAGSGGGSAAAAWGSGNGGGDSSYANGSGAGATGAAAVFTAGAVADSQIAAEVTEIGAAVGALKAALEALRANADASRAGMLALNLREARDGLARRLREATLPAGAGGGGGGGGAAGGGSGGGGDAAASLGAARREAALLLQDVDAQFFPGLGA